MKPQRSNSRNDALLEAAAELFANQGYKSTSMRDISKAVGMLPGSIYYHFASKDDLLLAIYEAGVEQITQAFEEAVGSLDDPWERLQAGMSAHIRAITEESAYTRVIFKVEPDDVPKYKHQLIALRDRFEAQFKSLVDDLALAPWVDGHLLRLMILGAGNHAQLWFTPGGGYAAEEIGARFCRLLRDSTCKPMGPDTSATLAATSSLAGVVQSAGNTGVESLNVPWPVRDTESFAFHSKHVGDTLAVGVWQPPEPFMQMRQIEGMPMDVVYVLDASALLGVALATAQLQLIDQDKPGFPPLLLVGIDYLVDKPNARTRDYTHSDLAVQQEPGELPPEQTIGGADAFLRFLEDELDPMIRSKYNVTDKPAGILGTSYGGTFTFHAFRRQSKLFDKYFLGSPGLFTTGVDYIGEVAKLLEGKLVQDTRMYLSFGELEMTGAYQDMGSNYNRLVGTLTKANNPQLEFDSKIYPDHSHTSIVVPANNDAMLYLYGHHRVQ